MCTGFATDSNLIACRLRCERRHSMVPCHLRPSRSQNRRRLERKLSGTAKRLHRCRSPRMRTWVQGHSSPRTFRPFDFCRFAPFICFTNWPRGTLQTCRMPFICFFGVTGAHALSVLASLQAPWPLRTPLCTLAWDHSVCVYEYRLTLRRIFCILVLTGDAALPRAGANLAPGRTFATANKTPNATL